MRVTHLFVKIRRREPVQAVAALDVTPHGIAGGAACQPLRQVLMTSLPVSHDLGLPPGALWENVAVDFAGLYDLPSGSVVAIGDARIHLTFHCEPCSRLANTGASGQLIHRRGYLGRFLDSGRVRVGDRLRVCGERAEPIPYAAKDRIAWYLARQALPVTAARLIFDLGLPTAYARALPAILRKLPNVRPDAVMFRNS